MREEGVNSAGSCKRLVILSHEPSADDKFGVYFRSRGVNGRGVGGVGGWSCRPIKVMTVQ